MDCVLEYVSCNCATPSFIMIGKSPVNVLPWMTQETLQLILLVVLNTYSWVATEWSLAELRSWAFRLWWQKCFAIIVWHFHNSWGMDLPLGPYLVATRSSQGSMARLHVWLIVILLTTIDVLILWQCSAQSLRLITLGWHHWNILQQSLVLVRLWNRLYICLDVLLFSLIDSFTLDVLSYIDFGSFVSSSFRSIEAFRHLSTTSNTGWSLLQMDTIDTHIAHDFISIWSIACLSRRWHSFQISEILRSQCALLRHCHCSQLGLFHLCELPLRTLLVQISDLVNALPHRHIHSFE